MIPPALYAIYTATKAAVLEDNISDNVVSIFLCGSHPSNKNSLRQSIKGAIQSRKSKYIYRVYYPEDLFMELIYGHQRRDLLSLENILATSVHAVVILLESPGTIAELGAFSNHPQLSNKLIILVENKYKDAKSFINQGPLRHLKKNTSSHVLPVDFSASNVSHIAEEICEYSRKLASQFPITPTITNPISAYRFFLSLIYLFDPIKKDQFIELVKNIEGDAADVLDVAEATLNTLTADGLIYSSVNGMSTTEKGNFQLLSSNATKTSSEKIAAFLYEQRIKSLNILLRRRKVR